MKRRLLVLVVCLSAFVSAARAAEPKAPLAKLELNDGDTLVFLGDSITHQCLYTQYVEDYFYTRFPQRRIRFHNAGVGGDRAADALVRFDQDVARFKPKYVTVLIGMNDGAYQPYNEEVFQTYRKGMLELMEKIVASGATPVLMTPTMYDSRAVRLRDPKTPASGRLELYNSVLAYYGAWLREQAVEAGFGFVDMYGPLNNLTLAARKKDAGFTMIKDAVHPDEPGQLVMAFALLDDLDVSRELSLVRISRASDGSPDISARGAKVSDARFSDDGVQFTVLEEGLPMPIVDGARVGAELLNLPHRISRETLEITGLAVGNYELLIDDQPVGTYSSQELARRVALEAKAKTPQYQQSQKIAQLNHERNKEAMKPLRDLWGAKKGLRYVRAGLEKAPDNADFKKRLADLEKATENFDEKVVSLEAKARDYEEQIYQGNRPQAHPYRLVRMR